MPQGQFTGSRIRERRIDQGLRQAELAKQAGISPSYLNLIEHNRRRIAGKLLNEIARALGLDPQVLSDGAESGTLDALRRAAARAGEGPGEAELDRIEEFAGRFPGWAGLLAAQDRSLDTLEARVRGMSDRLAHDPQLASSLHEVISAVTSIRSTSGILTGGEEIDADWQARFHRNIYDDAQRLADSSQALVRYLDETGAERGAPLSAIEEADALIEARGGHLPEIEREGAEAIEAVLADATELVSGAGRAVARQRLERYAADAGVLPLAAFSEAARDEGHDPLALSRRFGVPLPRVMRRLASLPPERGHPVTGLAICDGAGVLTALTPLSEASLPRAGGACPLWPLFEALSRPGQPLRSLVRLPSGTSPALLAYAVCEPLGGVGYGAPVTHEATMIYTAAPPDMAGEEARAVGLSCRICPRDDCAARREPSILAGADLAAR
ncbi:short-chain fatty acyl-CoA regulator family protein [Histidinibacterium aquaticum]|uniref:Helix-turn-helix domain-containing protein n=1 Tax=Histidinibacterium aquaticum TaxID=2613962 RepID=A0A5J5GCD3_9RHOB|nr:short-chain fatty acyl-CoA regulator family protein [Histidinibacterium aquaticum]KAA9005630.1 helix-turn-helix domain-containing protein [Histidinibacterium aquaticum]